MTHPLDEITQATINLRPPCPTHLGAYGEKARIKGDWLVPLPSRTSAREAMAIGTASYTAMLALIAMEHHGLTPVRGPVLVKRPLAASARWPSPSMRSAASA